VEAVRNRRCRDPEQTPGRRSSGRPVAGCLDGAGMDRVLRVVAVAARSLADASPASRNRCRRGGGGAVRNPSLSRSRKQTSWPSQFWSIRRRSSRRRVDRGAGVVAVAAGSVAGASPASRSRCRPSGGEESGTRRVEIPEADLLAVAVLVDPSPVVSTAPGWIERWCRRSRPRVGAGASPASAQSVSPRWRWRRSGTRRCRGPGSRPPGIAVLVDPVAGRLARRDGSRRWCRRSRRRVAGERLAGVGAVGVGRVAVRRSGTRRVEILKQTPGRRSSGRSIPSSRRRRG